MFFVSNSKALFGYVVLAAMFSAIIHGAVVSFMAPFALPAFTFPFNVVAWIWCLAGPAMGNLLPVQIPYITIPEHHINRVKLINKIT
jgi:urea transporter